MSRRSALPTAMAGIGVVLLAAAGMAAIVSTFAADFQNGKKWS
jgi:hypothetical protein